jgi:hypothetical protein
MQIPKRTNKFYDTTRFEYPQIRVYPPRAQVLPVLADAALSGVCSHGARGRPYCTLSAM